MVGHALELNPGLSASGDEEFDQVGIETLEGSRSAVDDGCGAARTRRDVGELEGDEAATVADKVTDIAPWHAACRRRIPYWHAPRADRRPVLR